MGIVGNKLVIVQEAGIDSLDVDIVLVIGRILVHMGILQKVTIISDNAFLDDKFVVIGEVGREGINNSNVTLINFCQNGAESCHGGLSSDHDNDHYTVKHDKEGANHQYHFQGLDIVGVGVPGNEHTKNS